jgi:rSAM/selenodomain-associated transferase 1
MVSIRAALARDVDRVGMVLSLGLGEEAARARLDVDKRLVILLKAPRPGQVKTRLGQVIGADAACAAYVRLVDQLTENLRHLPEVSLCYAPDDAAREIERWRQPSWDLFPQNPADLGARLISAFAREFDQGAGRVVVIGSDCPTVASHDIHAAWDALVEVDAVIGPASDGGYWLIGLCAPQPSLFTEMKWSDAHVLTETLRRADNARLSVRLLRELSDIDTVQDWEQWSVRRET